MFLNSRDVNYVHPSDVSLGGIPKKFIMKLRKFKVRLVCVLFTGLGEMIFSTSSHY